MKTTVYEEYKKVFGTEEFLKILLQVKLENLSYLVPIFTKFAYELLSKFSLPRQIVRVRPFDPRDITGTPLVVTKKESSIDEGNHDFSPDKVILEQAYFLFCDIFSYMINTEESLFMHRLNTSSIETIKGNKESTLYSLQEAIHHISEMAHNPVKIILGEGVKRAFLKDITTRNFIKEDSDNSPEICGLNVVYDDEELDFHRSSQLLQPYSFYVFSECPSAYFVDHGFSCTQIFKKYEVHGENGFYSSTSSPTGNWKILLDSCLEINHSLKHQVVKVELL